MRRTMIVYLMILLLSLHTFAHSDRIFKIKISGVVEGIPSEYPQVRLFFDESPIKLQIGGGIIEFPECISKNIPGATKGDVRVTGSWHHDLKVLPPYINLSFPVFYDDKKFELLFDLSNGDLLKVAFQYSNENAKGDVIIREKQFKLSEICNKDEIKKLNPNAELLKAREKANPLIRIKDIPAAAIKPCRDLEGRIAEVDEERDFGHVYDGSSAPHSRLVNACQRDGSWLVFCERGGFYPHYLKVSLKKSKTGENGAPAITEIRSKTDLESALVDCKESKD